MLLIFIKSVGYRDIKKKALEHMKLESIKWNIGSWESCELSHGKTIITGDNEYRVETEKEKIMSYLLNFFSSIYFGLDF